MSKFTATEILALGGNTWTPRNGGPTRIYLDTQIWAPLIGLEVTTYNTGNISGATLNGSKLSNTKAHKLLAGSKIYWMDGHIYAQGGVADYLDEIVEVVAAELTEIENAAHAEDAERAAAQTPATPATDTPAETPDAATTITALRQAGWTARRIAAAIGVAVSTIYRWAHAACRPRPANAANLAALTA